MERTPPFIRFPAMINIQSYVRAVADGNIRNTEKAKIYTPLIENPLV